MGRKLKRALEREDRKYVGDDAKFDLAMAQRIFTKEISNDLHEKVVNEILALMLVLPMEVLMDHYWVEEKDYKKKIPEFIEYVLEYHQKWENGELNLDEMKEDLWTYAGIRLEAVEE